MARHRQQCHQATSERQIAVAPLSLERGRLLSEGKGHTIDRHSTAKRKQLDWVVEAAHWIFADTFEIELAFDEVGECARQQHRSAQLFGEGFETKPC